MADENREPAIYTGQLDDNGFAIVPIALLGEDLESGLEKANALIDTGANVSACKESLFKKLSFKKVRGLPTDSLQDSSTKLEEEYLGVLYFPFSTDMGHVQFVVREKLHGSTFDFVIGTWFLKRYCEFSYNKEADSFTLKFKV